MSYRVVDRLARGGMGLVELAEAPDGTRVALKRIAIRGTVAEMDTARSRIRREVESLSSIDHPNVVRLLDVVSDGDDLVLVMPYLSGGSLAERVARDGALSAEMIDRLRIDLLGALAAAHRCGVVHRDITPSNVIFDDAGSAVLVDFGVAIGPNATPGLTASGMVLGTPGYMAPEQARGEDATWRSDIFALGGTLAFAASGVGPYGRGDPRVQMWRAAEGQVIGAPRSLPTGLRHSIDSLLAAEPAERPSAAEALGGIGGTRAVVVAQSSPLPRWRRTAVIAAATLALAAGVGTGSSLAAADTAAKSPARATSQVMIAPAQKSPHCVPLMYMECGAPAPAPNTNGKACAGLNADYDGRPGNGCEAEPDPFDGRFLESSLEPTLVPADDIDTFLLHVSDKRQLFCNGAITLAVTAPRDAALRLDIFDQTTLIGSAVSADGERSTLRIAEPSCFVDDSTTLTVQITSIGSPVAAPYVVTRQGSW